jgi:hypothetical protein
MIDAEPTTPASRCRPDRVAWYTAMPLTSSPVFSPPRKYLRAPKPVHFGDHAEAAERAALARIAEREAALGRR